VKRERGGKEGEKKKQGESIIPEKGGRGGGERGVQKRKEPFPSSSSPVLSERRKGKRVGPFQCGLFREEEKKKGGKLSGEKKVHRA